MKLEAWDEFTGRDVANLAKAWLPPASIAFLAIGVWEFWVWQFDVQHWLLPPPSSIAKEIGNSAGLLTEHALLTLREIVIGFAFAAGFGVVLASAIAYSKVLERSMYPFVIGSQMIPIITIAPLLLVWVGPGVMLKVIVVALISFFPIVVNLADGMRTVDRDMVNMFRTLGASHRQVFLKLQVPASMPFLMSGLKVAIVVAVIGAVIGEWVGATGGLGWLMRLSAPQFLTARVFAAIVVLTIMGVALFAAISVLERVVLRRYPGIR
jgi:ABC-type nitrate/sulfonate/bicarbonate transport system permease component